MFEIKLSRQNSGSHGPRDEWHGVKQISLPVFPGERVGGGPNPQENRPLTLTLSPEYKGEGTRKLLNPIHSPTAPNRHLIAPPVDALAKTIAAILLTR